MTEGTLGMTEGTLGMTKGALGMTEGALRMADGALRMTERKDTIELASQGGRHANTTFGETNNPAPF